MTPQTEEQVRSASRLLEDIAWAFLAEVRPDFHPNAILENPDAGESFARDAARLRCRVTISGQKRALIVEQPNESGDLVDEMPVNAEAIAEALATVLLADISPFVVPSGECAVSIQLCEVNRKGVTLLTLDDVRGEVEQERKDAVGAEVWR